LERLGKGSSVTITRAAIYYNLTVMLEAGLPVAQSLRAAAAGARGKLQRGFAAVARGASAGDALAETMAKYPRAFDRLEVLLVEVGETAGHLSECLRLLSEWYAFGDRLRKRFTSGILLPVVVLHAAAVISPLPSVFLGALGMLGYIRQVVGTLALLYVPAGIILAIVHLTPKTGLLRRLLDRAVLKIPLLGRGIRKLALSRYFRAFAMLHEASVPIVRSASLAVEVGGNSVVMDLLRGGADSARAGNPVSEGFSPMLEREYLETWRIGEQTGTLDEAARRLANITAEGAERIFTELSRWVPRLIYWLICVLMIVRIFQGFAMIM